MASQCGRIAGNRGWIVTCSDLNKSSDPPAGASATPDCASFFVVAAGNTCTHPEAIAAEWPGWGRPGEEVIRGVPQRLFARKARSHGMDRATWSRTHSWMGQLLVQAGWSIDAVLAEVTGPWPIG